MKFIVSRNELLKALQNLVTVVERRQLPGNLGSVLLVCENGGLTFTATDLEVEILCRCEAQVLVEGRMLLPARKMHDLCRSLAEGAELSVESIDNDKIVVKSGRSKFQLVSGNADQFPKMETDAETTQFDVDAKQLLGLLVGSSFAMANQDVRYYLNGLLIELNNQKIIAVATDGHRLALNEMVHSHPFENRQIIIPRKTVLEIERLLNAEIGSISIYLGESFLQINTTSGYLRSKLIDGKFPDYNRVVPTSNDKIVSVSREKIKQAISRVAVVANDKQRGIKITIEAGILKAHAHNSDQEEGEEEIDVDYQGEKIEIAFNVQYLLDVLNTIDHENIVMQLKSSEHSALIIHPEKSEIRYVIMPMRL